MGPCVHIIELHESVTFVHSDVVIKSMPDLHIAASYIVAGRWRCLITGVTIARRMVLQVYVIYM